IARYGAMGCVGPRPGIPPSESDSRLADALVTGIFDRTPEAAPRSGVNKGQCCIVRPVRLPERGHGDGRLIRWRSQAGRMLGEPVARWDARGEFAAIAAQVLGERVASA